MKNDSPGLNIIFNRNFLLIIAGIIFITVSLIVDPDTLNLLVDHIIEDLTKDLFIHLLIAGIVLIIIGFLRQFFESRK